MQNFRMLNLYSACSNWQVWKVELSSIFPFVIETSSGRQIHYKFLITDINIADIQSDSLPNRFTAFIIHCCDKIWPQVMAMCRELLTTQHTLQVAIRK
jgi:hypothetical protein